MLISKKRHKYPGKPELDPFVILKQSKYLSDTGKNHIVSQKLKFIYPPRMKITFRILILVNLFHTNVEEIRFFSLINEIINFCKVSDFI